jgi:hypothetical protein
MRYRWLAGPPDQTPCPGSTLSTVGRQNIHSQPCVRRSCVIRTTIVQVKGTPDIPSHEHHAHLNVPMLGRNKELLKLGRHKIGIHQVAGRIVLHGFSPYLQLSQGWCVRDDQFGERRSGQGKRDHAAAPSAPQWRMWSRGSTSRMLAGDGSSPSGAARLMKDVQRSRTMGEAHATQGQGAHRYGRCRTHCRQYMWDTLPAGCLDMRRLLWRGASMRETGARSLLGGMTPSTAWRSSAFDGPRNTSDVSSRPRYARSWYDRPWKRQHGWPRIPFLLCQRDRHPPGLYSC